MTGAVCPRQKGEKGKQKKDGTEKCVSTSEKIVGNSEKQCFSKSAHYLF